jgi:hypothetical protein
MSVAHRWVERPAGERPKLPRLEARLQHPTYWLSPRCYVPLSIGGRSTFMVHAPFHGFNDV